MALGGSTATQTPHRRWRNKLRNSAIVSLQQNLKGNDGKEVLTGAELGPAETWRRGEEEQHGVDGEVGDGVLLLQGQVEDMRS
jgi:hypothetical protein